MISHSKISSVLKIENLHCVQDVECKELCIFRKEPYMLWKEPHSVKRALHLLKRALFIMCCKQEQMLGIAESHAIKAFDKIKYRLPFMPGKTTVVCCSALQCVAVCCSLLQCVAVCSSPGMNVEAQVCCSVLQCVAVCCSVLQCVVVCCRVLQCVVLSCGNKGL